MPVETCYRTLDVLLWLVSTFIPFALILAYRQQPHLLRTNPIFWLMVAMEMLVIATAVFRGWPFRVRYTVLASQLFTFTVGVAAVIGLTPNWSFGIVLLVSITSLFSGTKAGFVTVVVIIISHVLVAWGWVTGRLPAFMPGHASISAFLDYTSATVWVRLLVVAAGLQAGLVILMRYVLHDMNNALKEATAAFQKLAAEQEHRARAEEARLRAERATREAQKFDALGRLASGVAHDFNNALCVMKCWSSILSEGTLTPW